MESSGTRIGIIGAGMTGLSCARELNACGFDVEVFDKSRGLGGRASTRRTDSGLRFDHGAQFFTVDDPRFETRAAEWLSRGVIAEWRGRVVDVEGTKVIDTSPQVRYVGVPGMSAMASDLGAGLPVRTSTQIIAVNHTPSGWVIETEDHEHIRHFDTLVVTLPAPQSAALLAWHPFAEIASSVQMTPCWAVMVAFESLVEVPWDGAFVKESPLAWVARNSSKPGRETKSDCWVLHASARWTASNLERSADVIATQVLDAFKSLPGRQLPPHRDLVAHRWRYSQGTDSEHRQMLFDQDINLIVCGDWLSRGRIQDAFLSGIRAASAIRDNAS